MLQNEEQKKQFSGEIGVLAVYLSFVGLPQKMIDLIYFYILSNQDSTNPIGFPWPIHHCGASHVHFSYKYIAILIQLF